MLSPGVMDAQKGGAISLHDKAHHILLYFLLSFSLPLSPSLSLSLLLSPSLSLSLSLSFPLFPSLSLSLPLSPSPFLSLSLPPLCLPLSPSLLPYACLLLAISFNSLLSSSPPYFTHTSLAFPLLMPYALPYNLF